MERGSAKHSPRLDDGLGQEVAGLVTGHGDEGRQSFKAKETPGEEEAGMGYRPELDDPDHRLTEAEIQQREDLARALVPSAFPARAAELLEVARRNSAPPTIIELLDRAPDRQYGNVQDLWRALGGRDDPPA